jgi:hypothetical protein
MKFPFIHRQKRFARFALECAALLLSSCNGEVSAGRDAGSAPTRPPEDGAQDTTPDRYE